MEITVQDKERVENILTVLLENGLPIQWEDTPYSKPVQIWIHENQDLFNKLDINVVSGASRVVIILRGNTTFVVKCDISQCGDEPDYCGREYEVYQSAVAHNLDHYFAQIIKGGYVYVNKHILPYYFMEYAQSDVEKLTSQISSNLKSENAEMTSDYISDYISEMTDNEHLEEVFGYVDELEGFLFSEQCDDFHFGNFGQSKDRGWVLIDYCGYDSCQSRFEQENDFDNEEDESDENED